MLSMEVLDNRGVRVIVSWSRGWVGGLGGDMNPSCVPTVDVI